MKKIRSYTKRLRKVSLVWRNTFSPSMHQSYHDKLTFLICHKIFWGYLRQGMFRKEFSIYFPMFLTSTMISQRHPYLSFIRSYPTSIVFSYDNLVEEILERCGFELIETPYLGNHFSYSFR